jgi:hypothetical protein
MSKHCSHFESERSQDDSLARATLRIGLGIVPVGFRYAEGLADLVEIEPAVSASRHRGGNEAFACVTLHRCWRHAEFDGEL